MLCYTNTIYTFNIRVKIQIDVYCKDGRMIIFFALRFLQYAYSFFKFAPFFLPTIQYYFYLCEINCIRGILQILA